jgi:hypothetical protein
MTERFDLYAAPHKALRHCMGTLQFELGRLDVSETDEILRVCSELEQLLAMLENHLFIENTVIHPALSAQRPALVAQLEREHEHHLRALELLRQDAASLQESLSQSEAARRAVLRHLHLSFSRFFGENLVHMALEETELNGLLWDALSDLELGALYQRIVSRESPSDLGRTVRWLLPAISHPERSGLVAGARATLPQETFAFVLDLARSALNAKDFERLERAI